MILNNVRCRPAMALLAAGFGLSATAFAEMHATEEFEAGTTRPITVALLPAHVAMSKQRILRQEAEVEESGVLEGHLTTAVATELAGKGYDVRVLTVDEINSDPELQSLVVEADRRFDELLGNVSRRLRKQIESRRYHAGDTMTLLANRLGVDALAFARMQIIVPAAGVRALNFGMGGEQTMMSVSLVDETTTDIEAYVTLPIMRRGSMFGGYEEIMSNPDEEMAKYAEGTLKDLLAADPSARVEASGEEVLEDLESLLD
jgi:hypothetical protein